MDQMNALQETKALGGKIATLQRKRTLLDQLNELTFEFNAKVKDAKASHERNKLTNLFAYECKSFPGTYQSLFKTSEEELRLQIQTLREELRDLEHARETTIDGRADIMRLYHEQQSLYRKAIQEQERVYKGSMALAGEGQEE